MRDHSLKHILAFALLFVALFAVLFAGVVKIHDRNMRRHVTAHYTPSAQPAPPTNTN